MQNIIRAEAPWKRKSSPGKRIVLYDTQDKIDTCLLCQKPECTNCKQYTAKSGRSKQRQTLAEFCAEVRKNSVYAGNLKYANNRKG